MMRMNKRLAMRWDTLHINDVLPGTVLQPKLREAIEAPLTSQPNGVFLEPLLANYLDRFENLTKIADDATGQEAHVNELPVEFYLANPGRTEAERLRILLLQGVKAAVVLSERLENAGKFRVIFSFDPDSLTAALRFFSRREGEAWGSDDPDDYQLEELLIIDTDGP